MPAIIQTIWKYKQLFIHLKNENFHVHPNNKVSIAVESITIMIIIIILTTTTTTTIIIIIIINEEKSKQ